MMNVTTLFPVDVNEREQNLDNDDFNQPDQLDASDGEKEELLNNECGPGDQFFPFSSKLHMLLYIFKNSPTHPEVRHECILCKWITYRYCIFWYMLTVTEKKM